MRVVAVIPARMGSSRFPGKPLARLAGMPMIEHVYWRTRMCPSVTDVIVATCDEEIVKAVGSFGGRAVMTSDTHVRATDRVAEAVRGVVADVVVMVQGDEPMIVPEMIEESLGPFRTDESIHCVNLVAPILDESEFRDPNTIKVVMGKGGDALYFSREPIPTLRGRPFQEVGALKQVCVIPFRSPMLARYSKLHPTPLEEAESVDMLRLLEHGYRVRMVPTRHSSHAVDTPADLSHVEALLGGDPLVGRYPRGHA